MICFFRRALYFALLLPFTVSAQLTYSATAFVHGLHDDEDRFRIPNTIGLLSSQIYLGDGGGKLPDTQGWQSIHVQADQLYSALSGQGHVLVGHSMGGLTSRSSYFRHPDGTYAAIITLTTPHQGAPIADNAVSAAGYVADQVTDFFQQLLNIGNRPVAGSILSQIVVDRIHGWFQAVLSDQVLAMLVSEFGLKDAAMNDIKTTSPTVAELAASDPLPHANVLGRIGRRNAVIRVAVSMKYRDSQYDYYIHWKNRIKSAVKACRQIGWNMIVRTNVGHICNQVDNALGSLDDRWAYFTMGPAEKRNPSATFDGLVPTSHSRYPGTSLTDPAVNFTAVTVNHQNIQYNPIGISEIVRAMQQVGMRPPPPPPPPPGTIGSVTISGPTEVQAGCPGSWNAIPYGGVGPYTYVWLVDGVTYDTGGSDQLDYVSGSPGSLNIQVTVTDSQGSTGSQSKLVSVTSGNCA